MRAFCIAMWSFVLLLGAAATAQPPVPPKDATEATRQVHAAFLAELPFSDERDFADAVKGFIAPLNPGVVKDMAGKTVWDIESYEMFMGRKDAPATVNPSLWRQERLNNISGLFKVTEGIYQVRGLDLSNMTIVEGNSGLIIIDPLISAETAAAGLRLFRDKVADRPVRAVIYSHSHVDHYGGVRGVLSEDEVRGGKIRIYAPAGFMAHAVSENVYAGAAMRRRALYMYGTPLPRDARGQVGAGLGKAVSRGTVSLVAPTHTIGEGGQAIERIEIDGLTMEFQLTPGTEAPAEMNIFIPSRRAFGAAENATRTMHNVLTLRGAQVRDPAVWAAYLDEAIARYGGGADVIFAQHHWPTWGADNIRTFLADQRDMYKYIHDQSLRLINQGYTPLEIAETLKALPPALAGKWYNRDYYGSMSHNVRAVYQRYLGYYDGNPANLNPLPPVEAAKQYVEFMGGAENVTTLARRSFGRGEYRWVAEVMKHVVFARPDYRPGRDLLADALEQMGYQTENATWRNALLTGALELRNGVPRGGPSTASADAIKALTPAMYFDYMGIRLNGPKAAGLPETTLIWNFTDTGEQRTVTLRNGTLTHRPGTLAAANATLHLTRRLLDDIGLGKLSFEAGIKSGAIRIDGDKRALLRLLANLDSFEPSFNIVTP